MTDDEIQLKNVDPDDIDDVLAKIQRSFGINFTQQGLGGATNFGKLCELVESSILLPHEDGCTSQQAFYKLREAIVQTRGINRNALVPSSRLDDIFPQKNRRKQIKRVEDTVGFCLKMLKPKSWVVNSIVACFLIAVALIFVNWTFGLAALLFSVVFMKAANYFANELNMETLGDAAEYFSLENYRVARRDKQTVNKHEVANTIKKLFMKHLDLPERALAKYAPFN